MQFTKALFFLLLISASYVRVQCGYGHHDDDDDGHNHHDDDDNDRPHYTERQLFRMHRDSTKLFFDGVIASNAAGILGGTQQPPDVLDLEVRGAVHPTFKPLNFELTYEYFWGLTANAFNGHKVTNITLQNFANQGDRSWVKAILHWTNAAGNVANYTLVTQLRFKENDPRKIVEYEVWAVNGVLFTRQVGVDIRIPAVRQGFISGTCGAIQGLCTGSNKQFDNHTECVDYMNTIPADDGGLQHTNTVSCRQLHFAMASLGPSFAAVHCPHTGRNSVRCIERTNAEMHAPLFHTFPRLIY